MNVSSSSWALTEQISSQCSTHSHEGEEADERGAAAQIPHIPSHFILPLHLRPRAPADYDAALTLPIVDLALCYDDDLPLQKLHSACSQWGIFYVINHGIPDPLLCNLQSHIETFLALPVAERSPCLLGNRGEGYGTGFVRSGTGVTEWRDNLRLHSFSISRRNYHVWPVDLGFRKALEGFSDETRKLQMKMLRLMSRSLGLGSRKLEEVVGEMQQTILMNHYPPCPEPDKAAGIDNHTDIGAISCLWQYDDVMGLHFLQDGKWLPVSPPSGALTIIVGDQVQIASNGIYKSPTHRGVLSLTRHRVSMVSFYQLKPEQVVAPVEELVDDEHPPLYQPTRFSDHELASKGPYSFSSIECGASSAG